MINGILNIYKEKGYTSHDVVAKMRGILKQRKIGHTGTLDPDATGVLPVCIGQATRLCDMLVDKTKTYRCTMLLGRETDTQDTSGKTLHTAPVTADTEKIRKAVMSFTGAYEQIPPMYSALKVDGKKLVDLARKGIEIERKPRRVMILGMRVESLDIPRVTMTVECTKGTYIRTLCRDIGEKLGCGGCMEELVRLKTGGFTIESALKLSEVEKLQESGKLSEYVISVESCFLKLPAYICKESADCLIHNGNRIPENYAKPMPLYYDEGKKRCAEAEFSGNKNNLRFYDSKGIFTGIYTKSDKGDFKPVKMFLEREQT